MYIYIIIFYGKGFLKQDQVVKFIEDAISPVDIQIRINANPHMKFLKAKLKGKKKVKLPIFSGDDSISGVINIQLRDDEEYEHLGIKCTLVGYLDLYQQKQLCTEFHSLTKELEPAGKIKKKCTLKYKFPNFQKQYESYYGVAGEVHYFIKVTIISSNYMPNSTKEVSFAVVKLDEVVIEKIQNKQTIQMEVGVGQKMGLQFEFQKNCFHLKDCILGRVLFNKVNLHIKSMELWLIRYEIFGIGKKTQTDKEVLIKYELMDDCPEEGDIIPIRLFLNGVPKLTPSYINIHNRMSVNYGLSLVLIDKKGKKYFKQTDIILYRKI